MWSLTKAHIKNSPVSYIAYTFIKHVFETIIELKFILLLSYTVIQITI